MRRLTPLLLAGVLLLGPAAGQASAVTIADLINLKANGLSDDLLIALIESDGSVFRLSADDLIDLRKRGLSDAVLIAMVLTAKRPVREPAMGVPSRNLLAESTAEIARQDYTVQPGQPGTVNVHQTVTQTQTVEQAPRETETQYVPIAVPVYVPAVVRPVRRIEPQYWGFGGKRRADAWDPRFDSKDDSKGDSKPETKPDLKPAPSTGRANASTSPAAVKTVAAKGGS